MQRFATIFCHPVKTPRMKKAALLILSALIYCAACKTSIHDSGCIVRYTGPTTFSNLTPGQRDTIQSLFRANGLSTDNLQFTYYYADTVTDSGVRYYNQFAGATFIRNGLPVFFEAQYWSFLNGIYHPAAGYAVPPATGGDTSGHQTLATLRNAFFKTYESALYTNRAFAGDPHLHRPGSYYRDSCLSAQLGYLDASSQPGNNTPYNTQLIKVWKVSPGITPFPRIAPSVFVVDSTGFAWCKIAIYPGEAFPIDYMNPQ
jgi:hypothetical protein